MKNKLVTEEQIRHLCERVLAPLGVTATEFQHILESGVIPDLVAGIRSRGHLRRGDIRPALGLDRWPDPTYFDVTVNIDRKFTLTDMALSTNCWTQPAREIGDRSFLGVRYEEVRISVIHFGKGRQMGYDEVLEELKSYGFRPVLIEELMALSAQHPHLQTKFPIAGIGCEEGDHGFWMLDCPARSKKRRVSGSFSKGIGICDFYRVAAVRDTKVARPVRGICWGRSPQEEILFVDSEREAMHSAYDGIAAS